MWKFDASHAVSADGAQCDRCFVVAREFAATLPCFYGPAIAKEAALARLQVMATTCKECSCTTGGGEFCFNHAPYTVYPQADGSFLVDGRRNGRQRVWLEPPSERGASALEIVERLADLWGLDAPITEPDKLHDLIEQARALVNGVDR